MAKQTFPGLATGGAGKKTVGFLFLAALIVFVVRNPSDAAEAAKGIGNLVVSVIDGIASFIRQVA